MADFVQTMKDWRRMCKTYTTDDDETCCKSCPIMALEYSEHDCDAIFSDWAESADWEEVEDIIQMWANENPEPVYPTWYEYLGDIYPASWDLIANKRVPADIAQKLGI